MDMCREPDPRWIPHAALNCNEDGIVMARQCFGYELLKYNFSVKTQKQSKCELPYFYSIELIESLKPDIFLLFGLEDRKLKIYSFNVKSENIELFNVSGDSPSVGGRYSFNVHISRNSIFVISRTEQGRQIYCADLQSMVWQKLMESPGSSKDSCPHLVQHDNKLFMFENILNSAGKKQCLVFLCDVMSQKIIDVQTYPCPTNGLPEMENFRIARHNDSIYIFSGTQNQDIWQFDFPTLTWSLLSVKLPDTMLKVNSDVTTDGQMYILGFSSREYKYYKINLARQPRCLQNLCWDMITDYPRSRPLTSYSNDQLYNFGIPKSFCLKLNW